MRRTQVAVVAYRVVGAPAAGRAVSLVDRRVVVAACAAVYLAVEDRTNGQYVGLTEP